MVSKAEAEAEAKEKARLAKLKKYRKPPKKRKLAIAHDSSIRISWGYLGQAIREPWSFQCHAQAIFDALPTKFSQWLSMWKQILAVRTEMTKNGTSFSFDCLHCLALPKGEIRQV